MILENKVLVTLAFILCIFSCKIPQSKEVVSLENTPTAKTIIGNTPDVSIKKADVLYTGIYNPLEITFPLGDSSDYEISCEGMDCKTYIYQGDYVIEAYSIGEVNVVLSKQGKLIRYPLKVENIPVSVPSFHPFKVQSGGKIASSSFKGRRSIFAVVENFPYDIRCKIYEFELTKTTAKGEVITSMNIGSSYQEKSAQLIRTAESGDTYSFMKIKAKCPGDKGNRELVPMVWEIE